MMESMDTNIWLAVIIGGMALVGLAMLITLAIFWHHIMVWYHEKRTNHLRAKESADHLATRQRISREQARQETLRMQMQTREMEAQAALAEHRLKDITSGKGVERLQRESDELRSQLNKCQAEKMATEEKCLVLESQVRQLMLDADASSTDVQRLEAELYELRQNMKRGDHGQAPLRIRPKAQAAPAPQPIASQASPAPLGHMPSAGTNDKTIPPEPKPSSRIPPKS
jgi:hypothetical protein